jgi:DNA polymerase-1
MTSKTSNRPILIVDGLNLFTRHFIANPTMTKKGEPAGGVMGFVKALAWLVDDIFPSKVVVVWEGGGSARKRAIFSDYKQKRRPQKLNRFYEDMPNTVQNRNWQVATTVALLRFLPVHQIYVENVEGDDVIGYICKYRFQNENKIILSSDKDFYQLLDENTQIYTPTGKKYVNTDIVLEKFQITPNNFCTAKALCGDPSDNVPGIKGVGFKSLAKRFPELGSLEDVSISDIIKEATSRRTPKGPKIYQRIEEGADVIKRNWKLMYLGSSTMSASQIKKVNASFDTFNPKHDKIGLLRKLVGEGLSTLEADRLFFTFSSVLKT